MAGYESSTSSEGIFDDLSDIFEDNKDNNGNENTKKTYIHTCKPIQAKRSGGLARKLEIDVDLDEALAFTDFVSHPTKISAFKDQKPDTISDIGNECQSYRYNCKKEESDSNLLNARGVYDIAPVKDAGPIDSSESDNNTTDTKHQPGPENVPELAHIKPVRSEECNARLIERHATNVKIERPGSTNVGGDRRCKKTKRKKRTRMSERNDEIRMRNLRLNLDNIISKQSKNTTVYSTSQSEGLKILHTGANIPEAGMKSDKAITSEQLKKCGNSTFQVDQKQTSNDKKPSFHDDLELGDLMYDSPDSGSWCDDLSSDFGYDSEMSDQSSSRISLDEDPPARDKPRDCTSNRTYVITTDQEPCKGHTDDMQKKKGTFRKLLKLIICCFKPKEEN